MDKVKTKGVIYTVWDNYSKGLLNRSINSIKDTYDYKVYNTDHYNYKGVSSRPGVWLDEENKLYDLTLFLDIDTVVKGDIEFGFKMAEKHGIACCHAPANSYEKFRKNNGLNLPELGKEEDIPLYNCGVLFIDTTHKGARNVLNSYKKLIENDVKNSYKTDQPYFAFACYVNNFNPYVLQKGYNYRPHLSYSGNLYGELKILHSRMND